MKKISFLLILISLITPISFANIGFYGSEINLNEINSEDDVNILSNLVNRDNSVKAEIYLIYELRNLQDMSLYYEDFKRLSFAPNEVKQINDTINFGSVPSGDFILNALVRSGSGAPLSFISHDLTINNHNVDSNIQFTQMPYLKIFYPYIDNRVRFELSYSNTGKPIVPNETFEVRFNIDNFDLTNKDYILKFYLRNSYSTENLEEIYSDVITLDNLSNEFIIDYKMDKAGTYDLFVSVYDIDDNTLLLNKEVRVVIMGEGGTIIDVFNFKDVYDVGQIFNLDVDIVGPADAVSVVKNPYLKLEVFKQDNLIHLDEKILDELPFNPLKYNFNFQTDVVLDYYKVVVTLGKEDKIYDQVELNYEPLNAELIIDNQGRIYDPNILACLDDGICSDSEKTIGNCIDCLIENKKNDDITPPKTQTQEKIPEEKTNFDFKLLVIALSLVAVGVIFILLKIYIRRSLK